MKTYITIAIIAIFGQIAIGQEGQATSSFSKSLGLFVFPKGDQTSETQAADEGACYKWAQDQTGYDPINPTKVEVKQADTDLDGSAIVGGAKGAAAGAAIGAIAGDAGKGAAIGAVAGGLAGRRSRLAHDQMEQQQNVAAATGESQKMTDDFKKAFTACMEAKNYTVQ